ncbi:MAG TPA: galactose oxidase, partial [Hyphomonas sp.]|nr:galactose oxidase [Hyphomonas sp.]
WAYDPSADIWVAIDPMPHPRHGLGAVTLDGAVYVIGGALKASGVETSALVEIYRP